MFWLLRVLQARFWWETVTYVGFLPKLTLTREINFEKLHEINGIFSLFPASKYPSSGAN